MVPCQEEREKKKKDEKHYLLNEKQVKEKNISSKAKEIVQETKGRTTRSVPFELRHHQDSIYAPIEH